MKVRIVAWFPRDRYRCGRIAVVDAASSRIVEGPWPVLGKSDNRRAAKAGNPERLTIRSHGDTPLGLYRIDGVRESAANEHYTFGPCRIILSALDGDALIRDERATNGDALLRIHGGALKPDGSLRPTYGCPRVHDSTLIRLRDYVLGIEPVRHFEARQEGT